MQCKLAERTKQNGNPAPRTADRIYENIRRAILSGRLLPGERITEALLAEQFAASRTPVRSAMVRLASDGFVETKPRSGTVVKNRSAHDIADIYDVRAILESAAAGRAAIARSDEDLAEMGRLQAEMEATFEAGPLDEPDTIANLSSLNMAFHQRILKAARNATLADSASRLMEISFLINTYVRLSQDEIARSLSDHRKLIAAFESSDVAWAEAVMRSHILAAKNSLMQV